MSGKFTDTELKAFEKLINSLADEVGQAIKHFGEFAEDAKAQIAFDWKHTDGKTYKVQIRVNKTGFDDEE